ncbi:MAG TPA: hypothetical protein VEF34_16035 [Syntrophobacteraceae bacterium]|nr:hypothetical protein [Syntrophobacteraceae bacterium]
MKKASTKEARKDDDGVRSEYDFTGGTRGKHYRAMQAGYTITVHKPDGETLVKEVSPRKGLVVLAPDVQKYFPDSESVNTALRSLIKLIPRKRAEGVKESKAPKRSQQST